MGTRKTLADVKAMLLEKHGKTVSIKEETFIGFKKQASFIDVDYGEWTAPVYSVCRGNRHKQRALMSRRFSESTIQSKLDNIFDGTITLKPGTYKGYDYECIFIDADYGEWKAYPQNVFRGNGHPIRVSKQKGENRRYTEKDIQKMLRESHGDNVSLVGSYQGMLIPTSFENDDGVFIAIPANVIHKKTSNPMSVNIEHQIKSHLYYVNHWKTKERLICQGSWEEKVVQYMNNFKLDYFWQPKTFTTSFGKRYRPDMYVADWNVWIEIKGLWRSGSKQKWEWFHSVYPNSELWDYKELKALEIL